MPPPAVVHASAYNFFVQDSSTGDIALYNAFSGGLIKLAGTSAAELALRLSDCGHVFSLDDLDPDLWGRLMNGGFLSETRLSQFQETKARFGAARLYTPAVLTITTTMDCNLGCYYCYEVRSKDALATGDLNAVLVVARRLISERGLSALHVDWYGGEPLLNLQFLEEASIALQVLCKQLRVSYVASIISNGTEWPPDVDEFIARHAVNQVQISFDGLAANHDKRRRYRKDWQAKGVSSFARTVALVDELVRCVRVDLRFNIDRKNSSDVLPFLEFAKLRGWFSSSFPAVFQPARLASYSESSAFMRKHELSLTEFDDLRSQVRDHLNQVASVEESEIPDGYPYPKTSVCAALSANSEVVGPDRRIYRCGLQVGETSRAVAWLHPNGTGIETLPDARWWRSFDPTELPTCHYCSFLPVCWGGCPKKHLEGDAHSVAEQGEYWRRNLPRLIAQRAGFREFAPRVFSQAVQFRSRPELAESRTSRAIEIVVI